MKRVLRGNYAFLSDNSHQLFHFLEHFTVSLVRRKRKRLVTNGSLLNLNIQVIAHLEVIMFEFLLSYTGLR